MEFKAHGTAVTEWRLWLMRLAYVVCIALWALTPFAAPGAELSSRPFSPTVQQQIEAAVHKDLAEYGGNQPVPGVVIGIWYPGEGSFVRAIGDGELSPRRPMALDDKFRVGSNTKTFVVTVLLQLVDERKLKLDDPVSTFNLGVKVPNGNHITIRHLMQMRSGLIDLYALPAFQALNIAPNATFNRGHWVQLALDHPPLFPPGTKWNYSNTNYMLLGMVIEAVTHDTVANEIDKRLLVPLGLKETSFPVRDPAMPPPYAHGYMLDPHNNWVDESAVLPPSVSWAAGVMISDMTDMKRWVKAYVTGTTNSAATQTERLTCLPIGKAGLAFGLGIGCSAGWYGYTGGITGYNTAAYYMPNKDATIIAFVNSQREPKGKPDVPNAIVRDIARIVFPENVPFQD
jgi:D-alanyl-D-alanine carboxypeptidase